MVQQQSPVVGEAALDAARPDHDRDWKSRISLKKRANLTPSVAIRLEGLAVLVLVGVVLVFFYASCRTLYVFPVPDSYRWYGDETQTWMLLGWKNLLAHGRLTVPIALGSTLEQAQGLLLGSSWVPAVCYGLPQLVLSADIDPITIGRTVTMAFALATLLVIGWTSYRLRLPTSARLLTLALLVTTRSFTFASHSARYDMMTGFAVVAFIAFFLLRVNPSGQSTKQTRRNEWMNDHPHGFAFLLGLGASFTAFTISPHLEALLILPTLYIAWRFGALSSLKNALWLLSGVAVAVAVLVGAYMAANHHISIGGVLFEENQAGEYIRNLPIMHLFSRSAQSHQLWAKGYYLWDEAPAFAIILPVILLSTILLWATRRRVDDPSSTIEHAYFLTICLAGVLVSALLMQSTLPYYLMHVLPLATLTLAVHLNAWRGAWWVRPLIAAAALGLAVEVALVWIPELHNAGRMGRRIDEANTTAVQAAIEQESRLWEPGSQKPVVLAQGPSVHELLRDTTIQLMTETFLFFPERRELPDSTIARQGVNYILDYNRPMTPEYEAAVRKNTPIFFRAGPLLDRTIDYFHDTTSELDTLTLYHVTSNE